MNIFPAVKPYVSLYTMNNYILIWDVKYTSYLFVMKPT
jgi:hypothetical protein